MPKPLITEEEAIIVADFLINSSDSMGFVQRGKAYLSQLIPYPRLRHIGIAFVLGLGAGAIGLFGAVFVIRHGYRVVKKSASFRWSSPSVSEQ